MDEMPPEVAAIVDAWLDRMDRQAFASLVASTSTNVTKVKVADMEVLRRHTAADPPPEDPLLAGRIMTWTGLPVFLSDEVPPGQALLMDDDDNIVGWIRL